MENKEEVELGRVMAPAHGFSRTTKNFWSRALSHTSQWYRGGKMEDVDLEEEGIFLPFTFEFLSSLVDTFISFKFQLFMSPQSA